MHISQWANELLLDDGRLVFRSDRQLAVCSANQSLSLSSFRLFFPFWLVFLWEETHSLATNRCLINEPTRFECKSMSTSLVEVCLALGRNSLGCIFLVWIYIKGNQKWDWILSGKGEEEEKFRVVVAVVRIYDLRAPGHTGAASWLEASRAIGGVKLPIKERTSFFFIFFSFSFTLSSFPLSEGSLISSSWINAIGLQVSLAVRLCVCVCTTLV